MIVERGGDILNDDADALVNPVNCVGVMGAGLAKQFKARWPDMFEDYRFDCRHGVLEIGDVHLWRGGGSPLIVNLPTKQHWRQPSRISHVRRGLMALRDVVIQFMDDGDDRISTVAIPALGCGLGGLDYADVRAVIVETFHDVDVEIRLYPPQ